MSEQDHIQATILRRPANDDKKAWGAYWEAQGQPWRTEPEIDMKRQKYLAERRKIKPDIIQGVYPFKGIKLSRADIEWLVATHENGRGPVDWNDGSQRKREGIDVRGADLSQVNLNFLPLTCLRGSLTWNEWLAGTETREQRSMAIVHMEKASMGNANLERANFYGAKLNEVELFGANLSGAGLGWADLKGADLGWAVLEGADLRGANLEGVLLFHASLKGADLREANLKGADLREASLEGTNLSGAKLEDALLMGVAIANSEHIGPQLADIQWGNANLAVVDWWQITMLGDEYEALHMLVQNSTKVRGERQRKFNTAVRAYRQLAVVLRNQGLNERAARFAYRGQLMQRKLFLEGVMQADKNVWIFGESLWQYLLSLFIDLLAGYGYKPWRSFIAYLVVIAAFATAYFVIGRTVGPALSPLGAWVFSMTSFHGRGFFPGGIKLDDPLTILAAIEAFAGLLIEVTFIATLTQRLFGK